MTRALLVTTSGGKCFLAPPDSEASLLEFARSTKATLELIDSSQSPPPLKAVVELLNNPQNLLGHPPRHQTLRTIWSPATAPVAALPTGTTIVQKGNYQGFLDQADKVKEYIKEELVAGKAVSLQSIGAWADSHKIKLSKGGLSRHLQKALDWAVGQGWTKQKIGRAYTITKNHNPRT